MVLIGVLGCQNSKQKILHMHRHKNSSFSDETLCVNSVIICKSGRNALALRNLRSEQQFTAEIRPIYGYLK